MSPSPRERLPHTPLHRVEASATPELASVEVKPGDAPDHYTLVVSPKPTLPVGPFNFRIQVAVVTPDGVRHRCGAVGVSGEVQPPIRVLPRVVLLGEHPVQDRAEADVTVRLPGDGWVIDRVETSDPDTAVVQCESGPDGAIRYRLMQHIRQPGDRVSTVRFVARRADGHTEAAVVDVRYHGEPARQ